jgi:hypothetical protein
MELLSPTGKTVRLFDRSCEGSKGIVILTYDSGVDLGCTTRTPQTAFLSLWPHLMAIWLQGVWTFRIRDAFKNDTGTLDSASIQICTKTFRHIRILIGMIFIISNLIR